MNATVFESGVEECIETLNGESIVIRAVEIRQERTGIHARVGIVLGDVRLAYDTFNVGRREERRGLARAAHAQLGKVTQTAYPLAQMVHDLDSFCLGLWEHWSTRFEPETDPDEELLVPMNFVVGGYIVEGGGTIAFGLPGVGKSYVALTMAIVVSYGSQTIWEVTPRSVLFVNLERPPGTVRRRIVALRKALGLPPAGALAIIHARGKTLRDVLSSVRSWAESKRSPLIVWDSISRGGMGSLIEDVTANSIVDGLNSIKGASWLAIAHTPRGEPEHLYGSIMFEGGEDVGVSVKSERKGDSLGVSLEVVKANDFAAPDPFYMAFDFSPETGLPEAVRVLEAGTEGEFPELSVGFPKTRFKKLLAYMDSVVMATATEAAAATGIKREMAAEWLKHRPEFIFAAKQGRNVFYRAREPSDPPLKE